MTDFAYDSDDQATVRAAYADLRNTQQNGFLISNVALGALLGREILAGSNNIAWWRRFSRRNVLFSVFTAGTM